MAIFQKSIVEKYLNTLDESLIENAFDTYKSVYVPKIDRIRNLKEEQYQTQFLQDIFGSILGYTIDPEAGYNIELEKKNESNSKKADGAIVKEDKVLGVIELKSNKTKNLDSIKDQAFGYKNNHKGCSYVISSNFHKLRFYVDDATEYEEFDLYNLDKESFKKFYLFLRKEGLLDKNIPKLLKEETKFHEENISKQLYKDYSSFKNKFFENIVKNNPEVDKLILFKKSQKFLDRILFILFAEDKNLIPTNAIPRIVESWALADDLHYKPLYELFKTFFIHLNVGHVYKSGYEIPAYGGGLFMPDDVLDNIKVDDEILKDDLLVLSKYDFNTDVDVNILGHIFEHSLSEIEETEAKLKGEQVDKSKGKRKKDGVFYTPKYITKYIVDNTLGELCNEKKSTLELDQDFDLIDYQKSGGGVNKKGEKLFHTLESYKKWLLELKIVDPACGSGAFLNEALSFLIKEHKEVDDLIAELTNTPLRIFDTEKSILENNIYGVDINEESVEIAKLSMWLRTAQKGRQLSDLSNNIKCGNSLIDDPEIAGEKAFNWENEFPQVFTKGGFDLVIGNPPYVRQELIDNIHKDFFSIRYEKSFNNSADLYVYFYDLSIQILKENGMLGFITPNKWMERKYGFELRKYLKSYNILQIINFGELKVFKDASTEPEITILKNQINISSDIKYVMIKSLFDAENYVYKLKPYKKETLNSSIWKFTDSNIKEILDKFNDSNITLNDYTKGGVYYGIKTGLNQAFIINDNIKNNICRKDIASNNILKKMVEGDDFESWSLNHSGRYMIATQYDLDVQKKYPAVLEYLDNFKNKLITRKDKGLNYWNLRSCDYYDKLEKPKLIYYHTAVKHSFYFDTKGYYISANCYFISNADRYLQCILNSKLFNFVKKFLFPAFGDSENGGRVRLDSNKMIKLPIKQVSEELKYKFLDLAEKISFESDNLQNQSSKLQRSLKRNFEDLKKLSKKLENWHDLTFTDFVKELKKKKIKLSLAEETEWEGYFLSEQQKALDLKSKIDKIDKEINSMIYKLYGLTDEEIAIIEND